MTSRWVGRLIAFALAAVLVALVSLLLGYPAACVSSLVVALVVLGVLLVVDFEHSTRPTS